MNQLSDLPTPCLVLDLDRLQRNIAMMKGRVKKLGPRLRAHLKTAKCAQIANLLVDIDNPGITVSTLKEADYFLSHGYRDILYAVSLTADKLPQLLELTNRGAQLKVILDSVVAARTISEACAKLNLPLSVLIEIDVDGQRAGINANDPALLEIARILHESKFTDLLGVMSHAGGSYGLRSQQAIADLAEQERALTVHAAEQLRVAGFACPEVSVGSTPTARFARNMAGVTEVRAGVFVFQDLFQAELGVCTIDDIALSVLTTVISHKPEHQRLLTNAGGLALSKDHSTASAPIDYGYGQACRLNDCQPITGLIVTSVNQEHGLLSSASSTVDYAAHPIGSRLRILPNHACMTAAAHDRYYLLQGEQVVGEWTRCNGW